jgi:hypothetical protein
LGLSFFAVAHETKHNLDRGVDVSAVGEDYFRPPSGGQD